MVITKVEGEQEGDEGKDLPDPDKEPIKKSKKEKKDKKDKATGPPSDLGESSSSEGGDPGGGGGGGGRPTASGNHADRLSRRKIDPITFEKLPNGLHEYNRWFTKCVNLITNAWRGNREQVKPWLDNIKEIPITDTASALQLIVEDEFSDIG